MNILQFEIECMGKDCKARKFPASFKLDPFCRGAILGRVYCGGENDSEFFELNLKELEPGKYRIDFISAHKEEFRGLGIPDSLLPRLADELNCDICSSIMRDKGDANEDRGPQSDSMWRRLVVKGLAYYAKDMQRFCCPSNREP